MASRRPFGSPAEQRDSTAKLVDYYKNLGFIPVNNSTNTQFNQKMVAKTKDVMTRLTVLVRGGGKNTRRNRKSKKSRKGKSRKSKKSKKNKSRKSNHR